jgi:transcription elongation factor
MWFLRKLRWRLSVQVGDLVRVKEGMYTGKTGLILRVHTQERAMHNELLATVDVLWKDGSFQSFVGKRFLEIIK